MKHLRNPGAEFPQCPVAGSAAETFAPRQEDDRRAVPVVAERLLRPAGRDRRIPLDATGPR